MDNVTIQERLARLEERLEHVEIQHTIKHKEVEEKLDTILDKFNTVTTELSRYKGFAGGCLFVLSAMWAFIKLAGSGLIHFGK